MKINNNLEPKSSFLSLEKDMHLIANMLLKNPHTAYLKYHFVFYKNIKKAKGKRRKAKVFFKIMTKKEPQKIFRGPIF